MRKQATLFLFVLIGGFLSAHQAIAQNQTYPNRPIRFVVPSSTGGPTDILARLFAERLAKAFSQPVVVENIAGAGGHIGAQLVARSVPDGYTLMIGSQNQMVVGPFLHPNIPYDVERDFAPVVQLVRVPYMLVASSTIPGNNLKELLTELRARPGKYNYASSNGYGSTAHIGAELLRRAAQVDINHIPYKGAAPAINDLLGGQVHLLFSIPGSVVAHLKTGRLRAIAIATPQRSTLLPDMPTFDESGLPGFEVTSWYNLMTRAGTPVNIISRLNAEINRALQQPELRVQLQKLDAEPSGGTTAEQVAFIQAERAKWGKFIKEAKITAEGN
ncbi:MAG: Bug family tripartite tricarboxylate transporter substrate binding protein [Burkholderiales bacterium]